MKQKVTPIWYIVMTQGQRLVRKEAFPYYIMSKIVGPFGSRKRAEEHRKAREYHYGEDSVVFCHSAYYSDLTKSM